MTQRDLLGDDSDVRHDDQARVTKVRGEHALPQGDTVEDAVTQFLSDNSEALQLGGPGDLRVVHKTSTPTGDVVRLQQFVGDVPVFKSQVVVAVDPDQRVQEVNVEPRPGLADAPAAIAAVPGDMLSADEAREKALEAIGPMTPRGEIPPPQEVFFPGDAGLRRAYVVLVPTRTPPHDWQVVVDATSGEIIERTDLIVHVNGQGLVFDPNPVASAHDTALRDPAATAAGCGFAGTARATIDAQRVTRTLRDITLGADGLHRLEGPYVRMREFTAPATAFPAEASANGFNYSSGDDRFECVQAYWTIDSLQRYLQSIGITTAHNSRIDVDPHDTDNGPAYFSPIDGGLHFSASGPCRPDRAEDAECIIHEYGHAIHHDQVPGWGVPNPVTGRSETRAMGEGFGDTLACVVTASQHGGFGRAVFEDWVFVDVGGLRRVDGSKVYPTDWHPTSEHANGEIWSAALWNIYRAIGGDSPDPAVQEAARRALLISLIYSHHRLAANASMPDGAEAVMVEHAAQPAYRGKYLKPMLDSFHARGLLRCPATDLWIRDDATDPGVDAFAGPFWDSPDLWIRHADDNGTTHQPPEFGQDNWFYARVRNRGATTARAFVVTFNVKLWAGTEFVYPGDWDPFVSAAVGFNLAPGATRIVKARWPASMVPAAGSHACWLASVYTPVESAAAGRHTWESNNLAQKNLTVLDVTPGDTARVPIQIGNLARFEAARMRLEVRRPQQFPALKIALTGDQAVIKRIFESTVSSGVTAPTVHEGAVAVATGDDLGPREAELSAAAGNGAGTGGEIVFDAGELTGLPVTLAAGPVTVGLRLTTPIDAKPGRTIDVDLVQRNAQKAIVGGVRVRLRVGKKG